jgi:coenzyme F420-0:L-glutamate ligase / coenzyme F420-1:gamma-L-glutamate ligase
MRRVADKSLNDFFRHLKQRRSIRQYNDKSIPLELIDRVLENARWAPSAHNAQPWGFFVIQSQEMKEKLAREMAESFRTDLINDGVPETAAGDRARTSIDRFSRAPVLILACIDMGRMDHYPDIFRQKAEETMATQSLAAATQNLLLSASAIGLGACWYCAPLFCPDVVRRAISIPDAWFPQALVTLGYPDEDPPAPPRLSLDEIRKIL